MGASEPADFENGSVDRFAGGSGERAMSSPGRALGRLVWTVAFIALPARPESTQQRGRAPALGKNKCQHAGCHRQPVFGPKGAARPEWCGQHRLEAHIDLRNPYCHRKTPRPLPLRCAFLTCCRQA